MKYAAQRNRLAALAARLPGAGTVLRIEGGLPRDFAPAKPQPPGHELKSQHAAFAKAAQVSHAAATHEANVANLRNLNARTRFKRPAPERCGQGQCR